MAAVKLLLAEGKAFSYRSLLGLKQESLSDGEESMVSQWCNVLELKGTAAKGM